MGRPLDTDLFEVSDLEKNPVVETEFALLAEPDFSVPLTELCLTETTTFPINGLWTPEVAVRAKYLDLINMVPVKLNFIGDMLLEFDVLKCCYLVTGSNTVADLCALVHTKLELDALAEIAISFEGKIMPEEMKMLTIYKDHPSPDGFVELDCTCYLISLEQSCKDELIIQSKKKVSPVLSCDKKLKRKVSLNPNKAFASLYGVPVMTNPRKDKSLGLDVKTGCSTTIFPKLACPQKKKPLKLKPKFSYDAKASGRPALVTSAGPLNLQ